MWVGGEASEMASRLALTESATAKAGGSGHARELRRQAVLALKAAADTQRRLIEAVQAVVEDGTGLDLEGEYPDDVAAFDLTQTPMVAYADLMRWFAAVEGRDSLARLVLESPMRRVMVAPDGHCWELSGPAEFHAGVREVYERDHGGELLELTLSSLNVDDPDSLVVVQEVRDGGVRLTVPASLTRDYAALYRVVMVERGKVDDSA